MTEGQTLQQAHTTGYAHVITNEPGKIHAAIKAISLELDAVGRNHKNEQQGFKYRGIDDIYNALHPLLAKHGVTTWPNVLNADYFDKQSKSGGVLIHARLKVAYAFTADDGSSVMAVVIGEGMDSGDKAGNKALTMAHKAVLTQVFTVPTIDIEADAESHEVARPVERKPAPIKASVKPLAQPAKKDDEFPMDVPLL